jgi:hypothetical protein
MMRITTHIGTLVFLVFLFSCLVYAKTVEEDDHLSSHATEVFCHKKIAIIGAGAGGSSMKENDYVQIQNYLPN